MSSDTGFPDRMNHLVDLMLDPRNHKKSMKKHSKFSYFMFFFKVIETKLRDFFNHEIFPDKKNKQHEKKRVVIQNYTQQDNDTPIWKRPISMF